MTHQIKRSRLFNEGLALSALPALAVVSYAVAKNTYLDGLFFFTPLLLALPLIGFAITYFSIRRIAKLINHSTADYSETAVIFTYVVYICLSIGGIYASFVRYEVPYAFILLPLTVDIVGAVFFVLVIYLFNLKIHNPRKIVFLIVLGFVLALVSQLLQIF